MLLVDSTRWNGTAHRAVARGAGNRVIGSVAYGYSTVPQVARNRDVRLRQFGSVGFRTSWRRLSRPSSNPTILRISEGVIEATSSFGSARFVSVSRRVLSAIFVPRFVGEVGCGGRDATSLMSTGTRRRRPRKMLVSTGSVGRWLQRPTSIEVIAAS